MIVNHCVLSYKRTVTRATRAAAQLSQHTNQVMNIVQFAPTNNLKKDCGLCWTPISPALFSHACDPVFPRN